MTEPATPESQYATYRERRTFAVTSPQGNLALTVMQQVEDAQDIYGIPGVWEPLFTGLSGLRVTATEADDIWIDGYLVDGEANALGKDHETPSNITIGESITSVVVPTPGGVYALRVWDTSSDNSRNFGSIDAFDFNPDWVVEGTFTEIPGGRVLGFEHLNDGETTRDEVIPGTITFQKDEVTYDLAAFRSGRALQLVFGDATNGVSTYSVGRFLFVAPNADGTITLDFNRAILPPCAFSYAFNCPMPPKQNRFPFAVTAGEKNVLNKAGSLLH